MANLSRVSTTLVKLVAKFAAGVVDTGGQHWAANISANFWKNSKRPKWYTQELGGKLIHDINQEQKISWHCTFHVYFVCMYLLKPGCFIPVELFSYRCMAAPSSSMAIVDFIPQSVTMNLATATNVVFQFCKRTRNKAFSEPRNTFLGCVSAKPYQNVWARTYGYFYGRLWYRPDKWVKFSAKIKKGCFIIPDDNITW